MATPANLRIEELPGSSDKEGREGTIDVFEVEHHLHQPIDPGTGQASGTRVHSPLIAQAVIDKATPGLLKALSTGRVLNEVVLEFYRIDPQTRSEVKYYEITMRDVRVVDIRPSVANTKKKENEGLGHAIEYSFMYREIEWNFIPESMVEVDTWRAPEKKK